MNVDQNALLESLDSVLLRHDVQRFSQQVLGLPYADAMRIIYGRNRYKSFHIAKRDGSRRLIQEPRKRLKELQYKVLEFLNSSARNPKSCVHGFISKRSIVTNASVHCNRRTNYLLNIDLEEFFPSITFFRVRGALGSPPFSLGYPVATIVAHMCTSIGVLPQGAPTSPFLSNLICRSLDKELMSLARRHRASYTRYADDLTFSFKVKNADQLPAAICKQSEQTVEIGRDLKEIILSNGFKINERKSRLSTRRNRMEVTGLAINSFPNVRRSFVDKVRGALHAWHKYGYQRAKERWNSRNEDEGEKPLWTRQTGPGRAPELKNVIRGKLLFLRMVKGRFDPLYTRLAERFNDLCRMELAHGPFVYQLLPVEKMVMTVADARRAVFVVEWIGNYTDPDTEVVEMVGGQGTAFLYQDLGLVTCDHIFRCTLNNGGEVDIASPNVDVDEVKVIDSENMDWSVGIDNRDSDRDLAVLQFLGDAPTVRHFVPYSERNLQGETGHILGYPDWSAGRPANLTKSDVVVTFVRHGLSRFEISANIRRGNSGGPFVDSSFKVAGVGQRGSSQTGGSDECLDIREVDRWIASL